MKQQLLLLENEIANAEDGPDLARIRTRFYEHLDSDKGSEGSEEVPIIDEPYLTMPVALEKVVQHPDSRLKEKLEPFIHESCLKETQPRIIVPVESQNLSDAQKMSRLLQFFEGKAKKGCSRF